MVKEILIAGAAAVVTLTLTLIVFWPSGLSAVDAPPGAPRAVAQPTLDYQGCKLTLKPSAGSYQPGEMATLELTAHNPTDKPVSLVATMKMMSMEKGSELSRLMPIAKEIWHGDYSLSLDPGQTRTAPIAADVPLPAGSIVTVTLTVDKSAINAARFAVEGSPPPATRPAKAAK